MAGEPEAGVARTSCCEMGSGEVVHANIQGRGVRIVQKRARAVRRLLVAGGSSPWARYGVGSRGGGLFEGPAGGPRACKGKMERERELWHHEDA